MPIDQIHLLPQSFADLSSSAQSFLSPVVTFILFPYEADFS